MEEIGCGRTSTVLRLRPGVVLKSPHSFRPGSGLAELTELAVTTEQAVLSRLQGHPRIVQYLGYYDEPGGPNGLLLAEASHGDLQTYLDTHPAPDRSLALKWCQQAVEAIAYVHSRGVVHSDLRTGNLLLHETVPGSGVLDLVLADFGGAACPELGVDGRGMPSTPFLHPVYATDDVASVGLDLFGLGSVCYVILTGHWPHSTAPGGRPAREAQARQEYEQRVDELFRQDIYPDVSTLPGGDVVLRCWLRKYTTAEDVLHDIRTGDVHVLEDGS
ncbi:Protein kinase-like domain protein [Niveomyces insectorum RCEF 264]|uniref:EKC/KEOPS complex subunit BUD32 n=1 Tax=Niveomyces insectorum RCEF 264 TaxID=1081102 RepID=A0A162IDI6_9HYPO|nr:Protein kinase-like domain protein [Niveomyces insectorum RCEF 264]